MRYLGSKTTLLGHIYSMVSEVCPTGVFCDPFGGIGTVGSFIKAKGYSVITGDILLFAHYYQKALLENTKETIESIQSKLGPDIEGYMNNLDVTDGWLVQEYAINRKYFTINNARKIQACVDRIALLKEKKIICELEYAVMISSLINSMDKVANTAGTYYAYLKDYYRKAQKPFCYRLLLPIDGSTECLSFQVDANLLVKSIECDILYLDPPYNERNYQRYYHLPETIASGVVPIPQGKSGVYVANEVTSAYNRKRDAENAFFELIKNAYAKYIIFHYTDNGLIDIQKARSILETKGKVEEYIVDCKGYNTNQRINNDRHHIFRVSQ